MSIEISRLQKPIHLEGLDRYEPGKPVAEVERELGLRDVVKLASNENPLGPSPRAMAALREALADLHRYPDGPATLLRRELAQQLGVGPDQVAIGNGSTDLIDLLARSFLGPEHNAIVSEGAFARFRQVVMARNGRAHLVPMRAMTHDLPAMARAADQRTRLLFVANPNNPTGTWNRRAEIEALLGELPPQVLLVLDEAYHEFAREEADYPDGTLWVRRGAPVVVLRTFSKVYGLAGLRVGYAIGAPEIIEALDTIREPFNSNSLGQLAARAALTDREHLRRTVELTVSERGALASALRSRGLRVLPSLGNFLLMDVERSGAEVFRRLLALGVIVRPMGAYQFPTALRVSIGLPQENARFLSALDQVLAEIPPA